MPDRVPEHVSLSDLDREHRLFATVGECAAILRWDPRTVRKLICAERIPAVDGDGATGFPSPGYAIRRTGRQCPDPWLACFYKS